MEGDDVTATAASTPATGIGATIRAYYELSKFRLSMLAVFAVVAGVYLGSASRDPSLPLLFGATAGTFLVAAGSGALNMFLERHLDLRMQRTVDRPLPSGRLLPEHALAFGVATSVVGLATLWVLTNAIATLSCAAILLLYVGVYTPLKRVTTLNTLVGALPGALPPVVGYTASSGRFDLFALCLFLILFFWQIPHFLAIAWRYREDYAAGGMQMLPSVAEGQVTSLQMFVYCCGLVIASLLPYQFGFVRDVYLGCALPLNAMFFLTTVYAAVRRSDLSMRLVFLTSIVYLPLLFVAMVADWLIYAR